MAASDTLKYDEGLGTVYERFMLEEIFGEFMRKYTIKRVLEAPIFGMTGVTGINSVYFAERGCRVTLVDGDRKRLDAAESVWEGLGLSDRATFVYSGDEKLPFGENSFDFVWNFAALWHVKDAPSLIDEMARVSSKLIFICVPNRIQFGYLLRKLVARDFFKKVNERWIDMGLIEGILERNNVNVIERGVFDIPPWPDTCFPVMRALPDRGRGGWRWSMMDYYRGDRELKRKVMRYAFIEKSPLPVGLKKLWAHHNYVLGEKVG